MKKKGIVFVGLVSYFFMLFTVSTTVPVSNAETGTTALRLVSETGDFVGQGIRQTIIPAEGTFSAERIPTDTSDPERHGVGISFRGFDFLGDRWSLRFGAPMDATLMPGIYENATELPFQATTEPGLRVDSNGRACGDLTGRFEVLEAVYGPSGEIEKFAANFEQHCGGEPPALFGEVRFNSSFPISVADAAITAVNTTADNLTAGDGNCTLREAITNANNDSDMTGGDCTAGAIADTIVIPAGTYTLGISGVNENANATGDLDIRVNNLTITGVDVANTIIDGGALDRVFHIIAGTVELSGLTIRNGSPDGAGGGIANSGDLTLINTLVSDNKAECCGGGISNNATLTLNNSTVSSNTTIHSRGSGAGGGIYNGGGTLILNSSTISGNSAVAFGGGIANGTDGSGSRSGTLILNNSTVSGNSAVGFGGGIATLGVAATKLKNTIVANNTAGGDCGGPKAITSLGHNLDSDSTCNLTDTTDLPNTNPNLGPLQDNGGPTSTHALLFSSPAIGHIPASECTKDEGNPVTTDQRSVTRPQGTACDIGAFEVEVKPSFELRQDPEDGAIVFKAEITRVPDLNPGSNGNVKLGSFHAQLTYGSCLNILGVREMDFPITNSIIENIGGTTSATGSATSGVPWPADLGHILTRLTGSANQECQVDLELTALTDVNGNPMAAPPALSRTVQRGDARADGAINIADVMFIAQNLAGLRDACVNVIDTNCMHSVNAASVWQDGELDMTTSADALVVAQYLVGLRDEFYNLKPQILPKFIIASGVAPGNSDTGTPGRSAIGFDGSNFLLVSCRTIGEPTGIYGVILSGNGEILKTFNISPGSRVRGSECSSLSPSIAFDGTNYLVVFHRQNERAQVQIVGTRVSTSGTVLDGPTGFVISSNASNARASVAFDGANYLVVWQKFTDIDRQQDIYGARVSPNGQVVDEFPIFIASGGQVFPSLAFDGVNYLVVWSDTRTGSAVGPEADIFGSRVTPAGVVLDTDGIAISTAPGQQNAPHVIFDGNDYFVVWSDTRNGPNTFPPILDIFGTRVKADGTLLDGPPDTGGLAINTTSSPKSHPRVSFDGTNYFVAWEVSFFYDPPVGIFGARVSSTDFLVDPPASTEGILLSEPSCFTCRLVFPDILFNGENILIAWVNNTERSGATKDIVGVFMVP